MWHEVTFPDRQASPGPLVVGRVERECVVNGVPLAVGAFVGLSITGLRTTNHHFPGLLYEVSDDAERDAAQYPVAVRCGAGLPLTIAAD